MGMHVYANGYGEPTAEFKKMKARFKREDEGDGISEEVENYFEGEAPGPGPLTPLGNATKDWSAEDRWGVEIDVSKIPEGVKTIRFIVSP